MVYANVCGWGFLFGSMSTVKAHPWMNDEIPRVKTKRTESQKTATSLVAAYTFCNRSKPQAIITQLISTD